MLRQGDYFDEERRRLLVSRDRERPRGQTRSGLRLTVDGGPESASSSNDSSLPPSPSSAASSNPAFFKTNQGVHRPRPRVVNDKSSDYGTVERDRRPGSAPPPGARSNGLHAPVRRSSSGGSAIGEAGGSPSTTGAESSSWQTRISLFTILSAVTLERVCFYALTGNLVLFLNKTPFLWESYHAMNALFLFFGVSYLMSIVGGWVADSFLGKFRTMVICYLIYIAGYTLMPFLAEESDTYNHEPKADFENATRPTKLPFVCGARDRHQDYGDNAFSDPCAWLVYTILVVIAIGSGALKANMCPFGSDQLPRASQHIQLSFFNWYYWCINIGSFIGLGLLSFVEQVYSFRLAFSICASMLLASGLVFSIGRVCYTCRDPDGSILSNVFKIVHEAFKRWRQRKQIQEPTLPPSIIETPESSTSSAVVARDSSSPLNPNKPEQQKIHFLDYAKHRHGGVFHSSLVDDVKKLGMIITVFAVLIPYWIVYFQMQTTFFFQGLHMRLDFSGKGVIDVTPWMNLSTASPPRATINTKNTTNSDSPQVVAAWFSLFDAVFVIILLPLFDRVIYPRMSRAGYPFTFSKRILLGMVFAMTAMVVAGVVEHYRLQLFWPYPEKPCVNASIPQDIAGTEYDAANLSVFWQIPQYALIGMSEVFTSVACLQFAVSVSPRSMKGLITGIFYCFCGIGSFLGTSILASLAASEVWIYSHNYGNINCRLPCHQVDPPRWEYSCHLDYYFFSLAGLAAVAIVLFMIVARHYGLGSDSLVINKSQAVLVENESRRRSGHVQVSAARNRTQPVAS